MSLFDHEEICEGCELAVFHSCCRKFCKCKDGHASGVDHSHGVCSWKRPSGSGNAQHAQPATPEQSAQQAVR